MTSKITQIASNIINGNLSDAKGAIRRLSKNELLNLIHEYSLQSGESIASSLDRIRRLV